MPRIARVVIPGCPHHVTQRGNHRQDVFYAEYDRGMYMDLLQEYFTRFQIAMPGYCLMTNHVHQILVPPSATSLAKGVGRLHNDFSRWQQIQLHQNGHLWQNRFFSTPLDEDHFWKALRYIELNPVRAGLVRFAWDWPWSSARAHVLGVDETGLLDMDSWRARYGGESWREFLLEELKNEDEVERIRLATRTGRPLGSEDFVRQLERATGRELLCKTRGPKPGR